jgi:hypothetical protein
LIISAALACSEHDTVSSFDDWNWEMQSGATFVGALVTAVRA